MCSGPSLSLNLCLSLCLCGKGDLEDGAEVWGDQRNHFRVGHEEMDRLDSGHSDFKCVTLLGEMPLKS